MKKYSCTKCRYIYKPLDGEPEMNIPPFTDFDSLDNFICPICKVNKDMFVEIEEIIHESTNENSLIELEEKHIPFYKIKNDKIIVQIGTEELSHPNTPEHFIGYIGLYDEDEKLIEHISLIDSDSYKNIVFDLPSDFLEVRAECNLHGIWKGIKL